MTLFLNHLANKLFPFRLFFYLLTACIAIAIIVNLIDPAEQLQENTLIYGLVAFIWLLLFNVMLNIFHGEAISERPNGLLQKLKFKLSAIVQKLLVIVFMSLSLVIIYLTFKLLNL